MERERGAAVRALDPPHGSDPRPQVLLHDAAKRFGLTLDCRLHGGASDYLPALGAKTLGGDLDRLLQREMAQRPADKGQREEQERQRNQRPEYDMQEGPHGLPRAAVMPVPGLDPGIVARTGGSTGCKVA